MIFVDEQIIYRNQPVKCWYVCSAALNKHPIFLILCTEEGTDTASYFTNAVSYD